MGSQCGSISVCLCDFGLFVAFPRVSISTEKWVKCYLFPTVSRLHGYHILSLTVSSARGGTFFPAESQATPSRCPIDICQMNERMMLMGWNTPKSDMPTENHVKTREGQCENEYIVSRVKRKVETGTDRGGYVLEEQGVCCLSWGVPFPKDM